ncbi:hypothetical protein AB434_2036 [Heyndrickxia coagulans]|uniref:Uncharacterized protein n=1 Tax=Heyndrickxia coagulans TaxID=1398 RepID=A0AAN0T906_HEYCO|nr:hypothetical protein SB48_HM08orf05255 [Heyndrickxia coagulans]AKN54441.1 hypothetical protein AB434_2036 [Heyndrickxia coagulans]
MNQRRCSLPEKSSRHTNGCMALKLNSLYSIKQGNIVVLLSATNTMQMDARL